MKKRSVTSRNLLGGFLGGVLGILAFSWINLLLPVGCFVGVVIGFWYQEILSGTIRGCRRTMAALRNFTKIVFLGPKDKFATFLKRVQTNLTDDKDPIGDSIFFLVRSVVIFGLRALRLGGRAIVGFLRCIYWPIKSVENRMSFMTLMAGIWVCTITTILVLPTFMNWIYSWRAQYNDEVPAFLCVALSSMLFILPIGNAINAITGDDYADIIRIRNRDKVRYQKYGLLWHFLCKFVAIAYNFILGLLWEFLGLLYISLGIVFMVSFALLPIAFATLGVRTFWKFARMKNHWPCFFVTLITTALTAFLLRESLHGSGLWVVALLAGCASGLVSEITRHVLCLLFVSAPSTVRWAYRKSDSTFDNDITQIWEKYWLWTKHYFIEWIPIHLSPI